MAATSRYQVKQDRILAAAGRIFAEKGYHETTIRDIARATRTSLAGLYYYAESKEKLLYAIASRAFDTVIAGAEQAIREAHTPETRLARLIHNHLDYFAAHLDEMKVLSHESESLTGSYRDSIQRRKRDYVNLVEQVLGAICNGKGHIEPATDGARRDLRVAALSLFGMMNWIYTWYRPSDGHIDTVATSMTQLFLRGFSAGRDHGPMSGDTIARTGSPGTNDSKKNRKGTPTDGR